MIKRLQKVGNRTALMLDKAILELMGVKARGHVQLVIRNGSLIITPVNPNPVSPEQFQRCLDRVIKDHGDVLKALARK